MKKLLAIIVVTLTCFSSANAEERVNLICNADVSINMDTNEITSITGTKGITIFPDSKEYSFQGNSGSYLESGNLITWIVGLGGRIVDKYYFDRVSGELTDVFGIMEDGKFKPALAQKYKCKKTDALF